MKFKKLLILGFAFIFCHSAFAELIELDNKHPDHCRQQVLNSPDQFPIILAYFSWCPEAQKFMENVYEPVAKEHPERSFFKFNMDDDKSDWQTFNHCLQLTGHIGSPSVFLYFVDQDSTGDKILFGPAREGGGGDMTKEEFLKLIDPNTAKNKMTFANQHSK